MRKTKRGGARVGAGRKPVMVKNKPVSISFDPYTLKKLDEVATEKGLSRSAYIDRLVRRDLNEPKQLKL